MISLSVPSLYDRQTIHTEVIKLEWFGFEFSIDTKVMRKHFEFFKKVIQHWLALEFESYFDSDIEV